MEHETKYQSGNNKDSRRSKPERPAQKIGGLRGLDGKNKGRARSAKRQAQVGAGKHVANAFLKTAFLPRLEETEAIAEHRENVEMERDFFKSLSIVCGKYGITVCEHGEAYPIGISLSLTDLRNKLKDSCRIDFREIRLMADQGKVFFAERKTYDTRRTLYYIPIVELCEMLDMEAYKKSADVLLSVFSYLYNIVDVPYHRQENSYLWYMYEMISEWKLDEEDEEYTEFSALYERACNIGDSLEILLHDPKHLIEFGQRLSQLSDASGFHAKCHKVATEFFALYQQYPDRSIYGKLGAEVDIEEDEDEQIVGLDKYVSFYESDEGMIGENLMDAVNTDLQELYNIDEPVIYIPVDGRMMEGNDFDFEERLFNLMEGLIFLLNSYKELKDEGHNK